jgi:hypothetical protein
MAVDSSIILRKQFEITNDVVTHVPTGYYLAPDGAERMGQLGEWLPSGEWYQPDDVREMATRLLVAHLRKKAVLSDEGRRPPEPASHSMSSLPTPEPPCRA